MKKYDIITIYLINIPFYIYKEGKTLKKFKFILKNTFSYSDLLSIVFVVLIYAIGWLSMPTIISLPNDALIKNKIIRSLYDFYQNNFVIYILVILIVPSFLTFLLYFYLKIKYIKKYKTYLSEEESYYRFVDFLNDAREVYIFGGDLSFLQKGGEQFEIIRRLQNRCKIICEDISKNADKNNIKELYKILYDSNVQIKCYNNNIRREISNIRGQLKIDNDGVIKSLFVKKYIKLECMNYLI